jgi:transcriptional regulator with XRE-family HTH domain
LGEVQRRLGARIKQIRLERQMTQEALAERAKRSYKYIGEVERGAANPSVDVLESLATALGVKIADFFAGGSGNEYAFREREVLLVREVAESLEEILTRIDRATTGRRDRPRAKKR